MKPNSNATALHNQEMVTVTHEIMMKGKSIRGGWSEKQLACFGVTTKNNSGWMRRMIGTSVPVADVRAFLALKDAHLEDADRAELEEATDDAVEMLLHLDRLAGQDPGEEAVETIGKMRRITHVMLKLANGWRP